MGLETGTYINDLNSSNPLGGDAKSAGDDHLRLIKATLKATFPGMAGAFARVQSKSSGYTVAAGDNTSLLRCTSALTLALTAAATLGNGHWFGVLADGAQVVIDPDASETINGATTLTLPSGGAALVWCSGSAFYAMTLNSDAELTALAGLTSAANKIPMFSGSGTATLLDFKDEDDMASDSATAVPSQQSVKAYAAANASTQTIWVPAGAMIARTTSGAASGTTETTTNKIMLKTLDFDASTDEFAQFHIRMPKGWNESTVTARFVWTATATGNVIWGLQGVAISDDDVLDAAFGTAQTVTDGVTAANDKMESAATSAITIAGTPAEGDWCVFQVYRDADNGSDTCTVDAKLLGVVLNYTTTSLNDA